MIFSVTENEGLFFLNGKYIAAPYTVETTEETISINGIAISIESQPFPGGFDFDGDRGFRGRGWRSEFGNRRPFGVANRDQFVDQETETQELTGREFRSRANFRTRGTARRMIEAFQSNLIVVLFEQTGELILIPDISEYDFCEVLLKPSPPTENIQNLVQFATRPETARLWQDWLQNYTPPESLLPLLTARSEKWRQIEDKNNREVEAVQRLENFSYPLTLLGMLVGVVSLGHLLRWPRKEDELEAGSQTVRAVEIALWLMLGMALIDLTWTLLATQAGVMKEINPMAEKLVRTPLQLAVFKTFATGLGLVIFFLWRRRRQVQVATWWMCLVCVLVTFRWVIFDSAISP